MKLFSYILCYILLVEIRGISSTINYSGEISRDHSKTIYFDGLIKYLREESKLHQVSFIVDHDHDQLDNADPMMNSLIKAVGKHFPSLTISYNETKLWFKRINTNIYKSYTNYRRTTLFVFQSKNRNSIKLIQDNLDVLNFATSLSLPRCLIINSFNSTHVYLNSTLHSFWQKRYLDITIMTYDQKLSITPFLSHINPFTKNYTAVEITSKVQWFPNKLRDLNKYEMMFDFECIHDYADRKLMKEKKIINILEKAMNFKNKGIKLYDTVFPDISFYEQGFIGEHVDVYVSSGLRFQKIDGIRAIIPISEIITRELAVSSELFQMILGTICIIVIILLLAFFMKFKRATWQTLNISQIIMGLPANQEPNSWLERIVFGSLLITCIVYTGYFYSVILDISLESEPEISTLEELANSTLIPLIPHQIFFHLQNSTIPYIRKLTERAERLPPTLALNDNYCLEQLIAYRNVTCLYANAEYQVNEFSAFKGKELNVKIITEAVDYYTSFWSSSQNLPFTDSFSEIIQKATEFGLFKEYYTSNAVYSKKFSPELIGKKKIFLIVSYVLGIGFTVSLIIILFELIFATLYKRVTIFPKRFRFVN